ncbi:MAG: patatin-like phospholipase family protein [Brevinematales bacterium]|jgi:NTE family protein
MPGFLSSFFNRKVALVLGSGGAKGLAHISIIEYICNLKIPIDMIVGSSIGALIGAVYCAGSLERFKKGLIEIPVSRYSEFFEPTLPVSGLLSDSRIMKFISDYIPESMNLEDLKTPLWVVATDYYTGMPYVFSQGNILEAVRASISIPGVFKPVRYKESILVDGGVANPLPIDIACEMGAGLTIAVNLHPMVRIKSAKKNVKEPGKESPKKDKENKTRFDIFIEKARSIANIRTDTLINTVISAMGKIQGGENLPNILEVISQSIDIMGYTNSKQMLEYNPPTVLIEPNLVHFNQLDFNRMEEAFGEGIRACEFEKDNLISKVRAMTKRMAAL